MVEGADNCNLAPPRIGVAPVGVDAEGAGPLLIAAVAGGAAAGVTCGVGCWMAAAEFGRAANEKLAGAAAGGLSESTGCDDA